MISPTSSTMIFMGRLQSNAPVSAAAMVRKLSNLVPGPGVPTNKIRAFGPSPAASLPVNFLFWRGAGSGCTLFPSPHGIVAVIGDENAGRAPANP